MFFFFNFILDARDIIKSFFYFSNTSFYTHILYKYINIHTINIIIVFTFRFIHARFFFLSQTQKKTKRVHNKSNLIFIIVIVFCFINELITLKNHNSDIIIV